MFSYLTCVEITKFNIKTLGLFHIENSIRHTGETHHNTVDVE